MKLPCIEQSKIQKQTPLIKEKYKIVLDEKNTSPAFKSNSFLSRMKDVKEVKIYLKEKMIKTEIDEQFMRDIEKEYAEQFLLKMKICPTKKLINKILKICPLKNCDFQLYDETVFVNYDEKNVKSLHIYPAIGRKEKKLINLQNNINNNFSRNLIYNLNKNKTINNNTQKFSNFKFNIYDKEKQNKYNHLSIETSPTFKNFSGTDDNFNSKNSLFSNSRNQRQNLRTINTNTNTEFLYNREKVDDLFIKYRENVANLQLFSNKKSIMKIDLSPENIRNRYFSSESNWSNKVYENKGKLSKISKSILSYKNVLNNEKYFFDLRRIKNLTPDIISEIKEPINVQVELVIKDINYILDNLPFEEFIDIKDNIELTHLSKKSKEINDINNSFTHNKIEIKTKKEFIEILKLLSSIDSCRIIILCINLIYWIILGKNNAVQIDVNTKELIYLKLMKEWDLMSSKFTNKTIFYGIYIPLFIIICRIEVENYFIRKYIYLFEDKKNKIIVLKKANAIISEIFDKHGYMNTFNLFCQKHDEFYKKFRTNNNFGHYKNKLYATSNFVELLFRNDNENLKTENDIKEKENFIANHKKKYFSFYLDKMNKNLKRRNLEPIFKINYKPDEIKEDTNILKIKSREDDINLNIKNE